MKTTKVQVGKYASLFVWCARFVWLVKICLLMSVILENLHFFSYAQLLIFFCIEIEQMSYSYHNYHVECCKLYLNSSGLILSQIPFIDLIHFIDLDY